MCSNYESGGLNMINIELMQKSFILEWARRLIEPTNESWKYAPLYFLSKVGGRKVFDCNTKQNEFKGDNMIKNAFWKNVTKSWCAYNNTNDIDLNNIEGNEPIFNNCKIKFKGSVLFLPASIEKGIFYIRVISFQSKILSFGQFINKFGSYPRGWLDYYLMFNAIKNKVINQANQDDNKHFFRSTSIEKLTRKNIYLLIRKNIRPTRIEEFWYSKGITLEKNTWLMSFKCTQETRLRVLQWKILHKIYPTAILLNKMGVTTNDQCEFC